VSRAPRGLSPEEAELWAKVAATVEPLRGRPEIAAHRHAAAPPKPESPARPKQAPAKVKGRQPLPPPVPPPPPPTARPLDRHGLDSSWERKLARAALAPDFTLDLHGHSLETAHARLDHGLTLALAQGARLVLVVTGKPRPVDAMDRGERRGAIRAKIIDWLAAGPHASRIAAIRPAHPRHGGSGALYLVLRR